MQGASLAKVTMTATEVTIEDFFATQRAINAKVVSARYQKFPLLILGFFAMSAAIVFSLWKPLDNPTIGVVLLLAGPVIGLYLLLKSQKDLHNHGFETNHTPYVAGFSGVCGGCLLAGLYVNEIWFVSMLLFVSALVIGFLGWFEKSGVGMTASLTLGIIAALLSISSFSSGAATTALLIGSVLFAGAWALE